jgi:hypothetical protein
VASNVKEAAMTDSSRYSRFFGDGEAADYQDDLITTLRSHSPTRLPDFLQECKPYTEPWRRFGRSPAKFIALNTGWKAIVELGREYEFLKGATSEEDWADVMARVFAFGEALGQGPQGALCAECEGQVEASSQDQANT